jgi:Fis family transcriptional regulator
MKRSERKPVAESGEAAVGQPLRDCVRKAIDKYFKDLDGERPGGLYQLVLAEVERPLLESVMNNARGNQSHAAEYLGISRSTLRKKLKLYQLD